MLVSSGGHLEIVKQLLDKGAEVNHQNRVSIVIILFKVFRLHVHSLHTCIVCHEIIK